MDPIQDLERSIKAKIIEYESLVRSFHKAERVVAPKVKSWQRNRRANFATVISQLCNRWASISHPSFQPLNDPEIELFSSILTMRCKKVALREAYFKARNKEILLMIQEIKQNHIF